MGVSLLFVVISIAICIYFLSVESAECAKKAVTIAIRYGCIRRQFGGHGGLETKIMDYQTHQQRLIPLLAQTFAISFTAMEVGRIYENLMTMLEQTKPGSPEMMKTIDALKETHATSAGIKALCTWKTLDMIEQCRQTLGGLGYSSYAGLASLFQDFAVQCTWEVCSYNVNSMLRVITLY